MTDSKSKPKSVATVPGVSLSALRRALCAPGRLAALALLGALCVTRAIDPGVVKIGRLRGFDFAQQLEPRRYVPLPVRIVAIDERSLAEYGQWPWPRTLVARLVRRIAAGHPRVLGVDIVFAEPDRLSPAQLAQRLPGLPPRLVRELSQLPPNEVALANAMRMVPTVLGVGVDSTPRTGARGAELAPPVRETGANPGPFLPHYASELRSLPLISAAQRGAGEIASVPNSDGVLLRLPLFVIAGGHLLPALALEMLQVAFGNGPLAIVTNQFGVRGALLHDSFIPTDRHGRAYPYFTPSLARRYISAADLLSGTYDPARLRGAIVFLGVTGLGLIDQKQTPLGIMPGAEVEAQLLESILTNDLLSRPAILGQIELVILPAIGLITIFGLPYRRPPLAAGLFIALVGVLLGTEFLCLRIDKLLFDGLYSSASAFLIFAVMLAASLRATEAARHRLATALERERESGARLEGELSAARAIQMGLLPRSFPEGRDRVDVQALVEPARMVGGDLYDFALLDNRRLWFAIADVSGKGVPAALVMALTKEVMHAASLRHGDALDRVFAEVGAKILSAGGSTADPGMRLMFVTVFSAVLDLASGRLSYASAGHDSPLILRGGSKVLPLAAVGGPPLGSVAGFPYQLEHYQLAPGELLLLYTDGVTEAENSQHAFYGGGRLARALASAGLACGAKEVIEHVRADLREFVGDAEQADDITLMAVRWLGGTTDDFGTL